MKDKYRTLKYACYTVISPFPVVGLFACAFTGLCVAMLWPGSLVVSSERIPDGGVFIYAMMAAGGDLGAALVPQAVGILTDKFGQISGVTEQIAMKMGMSVGIIFPFLAIFVFLYIWKTQKKEL